MDKASPREAVAGNGLNSAAPLRSPAHSPPEGQQRQMLADARASVVGYLANLIGARRADVAYALYPDLGPIEAVETLNRNLRGKEKRKIGVHELDTIFDVLGREQEESWIRFVMRRRGIVPPPSFDREGELEKLQRENASLREEVARKDAAIAEQARAFVGTEAINERDRR